MHGVRGRLPKKPASSPTIFFSSKFDKSALLRLGGWESGYKFAEGGEFILCILDNKVHLKGY